MALSAASRLCRVWTSLMLQASSAHFHKLSTTGHTMSSRNLRKLGANQPSNCNVRWPLRPEALSEVYWPWRGIYTALFWQLKVYHEPKTTICLAIQLLRCLDTCRYYHVLPKHHSVFLILVFGWQIAYLLKFLRRAYTPAWGSLRGVSPSRGAYATLRCVGICLHSHDSILFSFVAWMDFNCCLGAG